jgi:ATP-dependent DNA helicase RecG
MPRRIPEQESLSVEFKSDRDRLPDRELVAAVVCLSNADGGDLYVGVEADGSLTGLHPAHQHVQGLAAMIANRTVPPLSVATVAEITSRTPATTLLVSVEPRSEPDIAPPRGLFGHHAACQRGAMFPTRSRPNHHVVRREHRSTLASSVVAKQRTSW